MKFWGGILVILLLTGCGSTRSIKSARHGLFDRLRELDGPPGQVSAHQELKSYGLGFQWPLKLVKVTSPFGNRNGDFHEGVDLHAPIGTPVYASQSGKVLYSGSKINGYGKLVVLKHASGISTVYAHNSKLLVRKGDFVTKGRLIAQSGKTGRAHGPHLHFEIRKGIEALNPVELDLGTAQSPKLAEEKSAKKSRKIASVKTKRVRR
jgi:murein DD-endopeptidase MepM/ murein hydrolase activator NlpD